MAQLPILPHGSPTTLSGISENFQFHSSPESFITSRVLAFQVSNPRLARSRAPVRARILNRNVGIIASYKQVQQCLYDEETMSHLSSSKAYNQLMAPFFPAPNLLLSDPPDHRPMKEIWSERMAILVPAVRPLMHEIVLDHFKGISSGSSIDLYDFMKRLSWRLLLAIFLSGQARDRPPAENASDIESLQEGLLRGQFSLFPVSVNTRIWQSPRSKGLEARKQLQSLFASQVIKGASSCPFATGNAQAQEDVASHLLLFTSSLAAKALASLLTALMMNLYLFKAPLKRDGPVETASSATSPTARIVKEYNETERREALRKLISETERLSPPVVGIMRRATQDIVLRPPSDQNETPSTLIPKGWDLWLYFTGAGRDPDVFGDDAELLQTCKSNEREGKVEVKEGFAFGAGPKSCLGRDLMREVAMVVAETCLGTEKIQGLSEGVKPGLVVSGEVNEIPNGVQGWLGWKKHVTPNEWARDMKQLPTQRPLKAVMVNITHNLVEV